MKFFDAQKLDARTNYKLISGLIVPRPIAWLSTESPSGIVNLAPFSFFTGASDELPLLTITILRRHNGETKDSARNLLTGKNGVVHIASQADLAVLNQTAATLEPDISEASINQLPLIASTVVTTPGLARAPARLEVTLYQHVPLAHPDGHVMSDLFVLQVVAYHLKNEVVDEDSAHIDVAALDPLARLAGPEYAALGARRILKRPK